MNRILIGVFDNSSQARAALARIAATGIDPSAMSLSGGTAAAPRADASGAATDKAGAVGRFFADLFASNDGAAAHSQAGQRRHVVLTVSATDDERADEVSELMQNCGAFDIDECDEPWHAGRNAAQRSRFGDEDAGPTGEHYAGAERRFNGGAGYFGQDRRVGA